MVCHHLAEAGYAVRALVRRPTTVLRADVETVSGDLESVGALRRGVDGAAAVVHLAGLVHVNRRSAALADRYEEVNVVGTQRLIEQALEAGVERFAFASTISVYGPSHGGPPWTEVDPVLPVTRYGETKLHAEQIVRAVPGGVVLRLAAVYGPNMKGNYKALIRVLKQGLHVLPGDGTNRRTLVHVDDAAQAFVEAIRSAPPGTYNVTDGQIHAFDAVVRSFQVVSGRRPGVRYVPVARLRAALDTPVTGVRVVGRHFPGVELIDKIVEDVAVSGDVFVSASGYRPRVLRLVDGWSAPERSK